MSDGVSYRFVTLVCCIVFGLSSQVQAEKLASIIIDDLGYNLERGRQVVDLPASITLSILPKTKHAKSIAELAHSKNKEVMLERINLFTQGKPINVKDARRRIADKLIEDNKYSF